MNEIKAEGGRRRAKKNTFCLKPSAFSLM